MHYVIPNKITQLLAELAELNIYVNTQKCLDKLVEFASIVVCRHQQGFVKGKLKSLLRLYRSRSSAQITPITSDSPNKGGRIVDVSGSAPMKQESVVNLTRKEETGIETSITTSAIKITYWLRELPNQALHYLPEYLPYYPPKFYVRSLRERVLEQVKEPLVVSDSRITSGFRELDEWKDRYLYVYWNRASFGLVKIGCTTVDVDRRLKKWEDKCQHIAEEHYRSPFKVKHVARVEKLIHTEFGEYRVYEPYCRGCGGKHIEWFRGLDLELVIKRMKAWTEWIMKEPYEEKQSLWRLKDSFESELQQTCANPSEANETKNGKASITKESPRYHLRRRRAPGSSQNPSSPIRS